MASTASEACACCGEPLTAAEIAFGARFCPSCSSQRADAARYRASDSAGGPDVTALEQQILDLVRRELAVDPTAVAALVDASGAPMSSETGSAGLVLIDGLGVLFRLGSDGTSESEDVEDAPAVGTDGDADSVK